MSQLSNKAGRHFLIDLWFTKDPFPGITGVKEAMNRAIDVSGATKLHEYFHEFGEGIGCTGVMCLAESHISVHTWPELEYVALDVFMCGDSKVDEAVDAMLAYFKASDAVVREFIRG